MNTYRLIQFRRAFAHHNWTPAQRRVHARQWARSLRVLGRKWALAGSMTGRHWRLPRTMV